MSNNPRILARRKGALERRSKDLATWQGKLGADADNKELQDKVEKAKTDVDNLNRKVGRLS